MAEGAGDDASADDGDRTDTAEQRIDAQEQRRWKPEVRLAIALGALGLASSAGLAGWNSYGAWQSHQADQQRELFLRVARQDAHDMTTIRHAQVESDVERILDLSVGTFHDDFAQRRQPFIEHIKHEQSTSLGTVMEAGLESVTDNSARALVTVSVKLTKADSGEQKLDGFRLRLDLQRVGAEIKVSDVEYVQ